MQLNINQTQQNPTFGYFNFSEPAMKYFKTTLKPEQFDRFTKIVQNEATNYTVEASIGYNNGRLNGYLRTYNAEKNPISDFCKDLGSQGIISKMINGPLGYLEKVSKASSKMLKQFCFSQEVENILKSTSNS